MAQISIMQRAYGLLACGTADSAEDPAAALIPSTNGIPPDLDH